MKFILGKKISMSQVFTADGKVVPVTKVVVGPCKVVGVKTKEKNGYNAVQLGFGQKKHLPKSVQGQLRTLGSFAKIKEFRLVQEEVKAKIGDEITCQTFAVGDVLTVTGFSKGHGFQGVVKRHHFAGGPRSHGHKDNARMPGAIGSGGIQKVFKGLRMAGRMGNEQVTIKGLQVMAVNPEDNSLLVAGALPGARNGFLMLKAEGELQVTTAPVVEEKKPEAVSEAAAAPVEPAAEPAPVEEAPKQA